MAPRIFRSSSKATISPVAVPSPPVRKGRAARPIGRRTERMPATLGGRLSTRSRRESPGIEPVRPGIQQVLDNLLQHRDTLAILPAGSGVFVREQWPVLTMPGTTLVVSECGASSATAATSAISTSRTQARPVNDTARSDVVFCAPERLSDLGFIEDLKRHKIDRVVIDDAHEIVRGDSATQPVVQDWGAAIHMLGRPTVLALSTMVTDAVVDAIRTQLHLPALDVIDTCFYRSNLRLSVVATTSTEEKLATVLRLVRQTAGAGIIYTATISAAEALVAALHEAGEVVLLYHGRLSAKDRARHQHQWMTGTCRILVAVNAAELGTDYPSLRFVIHYQIPASLDMYYKEVRCAGHDQLPAQCILLYDLKDKRLQQFFLARRSPSGEEINSVYVALQTLAAEMPAVSMARLQEALPAVSGKKLQVALALLVENGFLVQDEQHPLRLKRERGDPKKIAKLANRYQDQSECEHRALERMVSYAQSGFCRWKVLLDYFAEPVEWARCGTCDNCLQPPEQALSPIPARQLAPKTHRVEKIPDIAMNQKVVVPKFGEGHVIAVTGEKITILFPDRQIRTFLRSFVTLVC